MFRLHRVRDPEVALPLMLLALWRFDVVSTLISELSCQARDTDIGKIIGMLSYPGAFTSFLKACASLPVGNQVRRGAIALVDKREVAGSRQVLIT